MQKKSVRLPSSHLSSSGSLSTNCLVDSSLLTAILADELGDPNREGLDGDTVADESVTGDPNNAGLDGVAEGGLDGVAEGVNCDFLLP